MRRTKPSPETVSPKLYSDSAGRFTVHHFVETRACDLPEPDGAAWEFIFECSITGGQRRYGVENRKAPSWAVEGN